jgi:ABC-type phosphate/phosphonate transport system permease subunit
MLFLVITLTIAGFGVGAIIATVLSWIRNRNALPVWTSQTDRAGNYAGKR